MKTTNCSPAISTSVITAMLFAAALPAMAGDSKKHRNKAHGQMDQGQSTPKPIEMSDVLIGGNSQGPSSSKPTSNSPYSFYNRFINGDPAGRREPLQSSFSSQFTHGDPTSAANNTYHPNDPKKKGSGFINGLPVTSTPTRKMYHAGDANDPNTYDGSPIVYHKPKPTSDTEDCHKKNKKEHHQHDND